MARTLAIFCQGGEGLVDEVDIVLIDVQAQQSKTTSGATTDAVQELQSLTNQILAVFAVGLVA